MRLAFCNATRRWGGVKTWSVEFGAALAALGHEVVIYGQDPAFIERAQSAGLEALPLTFGCDYNPLTTAFFFREFRKRGTQAVLVNVGKDLRSAGLAARLGKIALAQRIGLPGDRRNCPTVRLDDALLAPHYLCPCHFIRNGLLRELPFVAPKRASVVYSAKNPVPDAAPPGRPLRLVSSSQVNANKGHEELAHTLARLKGEGCDFIWEVAGTGDKLAELQKLCAALGLDRQTRFHGFTQDVPSLLRACDVFVLSSYTEGLPNTLLEAMACALAPVARDVGGVRECMPPALDGFLAPYGPGAGADWPRLPPEALPLYAPLRELLRAPQERVARCKALALEHCRTHFSLAVQSRALEAFFQKLIARRLPGAGQGR